MQTAMTSATRRTSHVLWGCVLVGVLASVLPGYAQEVPIVPYLSTGYRYLVVSQGGGPAGFEQPGFDDSSWSIGNAAFGLFGLGLFVGCGTFYGCPLDPTAQTCWPLETDILLRKTFTLPADASNVRVAVAIDNDIQVFINGVDISGGLQQSGGCAFRDQFTFTVPDNILVFGGTNLLAVRARDEGGDSYVDVEVRATLASSTMDKVTGGGAISPDGAILQLAEMLIQSGSPNAGVGGKATFGFVAQQSSGDPVPSGNLTYHDHGTNIDIKATAYTVLVIAPTCTHATMQGMATVNGVSESFQVDVDDLREPGVGADTFSITTDSYMATGVLIGGNIQIHDCP